MTGLCGSGEGQLEFFDKSGESGVMLFLGVDGGRVCGLSLRLPAEIMY